MQGGVTHSENKICPQRAARVLELGHCGCHSIHACTPMPQIWLADLNVARSCQECTLRQLTRTCKVCIAARYIHTCERTELLTLTTRLTQGTMTMLLAHQRVPQLQARDEGFVQYDGHMYQEGIVSYSLGLSPFCCYQHRQTSKLMINCCKTPRLVHKAFCNVHEMASAMPSNGQHYSAGQHSAKPSTTDLSVNGHALACCCPVRASINRMSNGCTRF